MSCCNRVREDISGAHLDMEILALRQLHFRTCPFLRQDQVLPHASESLRASPTCFLIWRAIDAQLTEFTRSLRNTLASLRVLISSTVALPGETIAFGSRTVAQATPLLVYGLAGYEKISVHTSIC